MTSHLSVLRPSHTTTETAKRVVVVHTHYNFCPYIKLLKKSLQLWKKVVVCTDYNCFFCSFSCSVRGPLSRKWRIVCHSNQHQCLNTKTFKVPMVIDVFNPNPLIEWQFNNAKSDQTLIGGVLVSSDVMWLWLFLPQDAL